MNQTLSKPPKPPVNTQLLVNRYRDAYRVASVVISFGSALKLIGVLVGLAPFVGVIALGNQGNMSEQLKTTYIVIGGVLGAMSWLVLYVLGVLASCQGQVLRAALDEAVYVCPFLSDDDRIESADLKRLPL